MGVWSCYFLRGFNGKHTELLIALGKKTTRFLLLLIGLLQFPMAQHEKEGTKLEMTKSMIRKDLELHRIISEVMRHENTSACGPQLSTVTKIPGLARESLFTMYFIYVLIHAADCSDVIAD